MKTMVIVAVIALIGGACIGSLIQRHIGNQRLVDLNRAWEIAVEQEHESRASEWVPVVGATYIAPTGGMIIVEEPICKTKAMLGSGTGGSGGSGGSGCFGHGPKPCDKVFHGGTGLKGIPQYQYVPKK